MFVKILKQRFSLRYNREQGRLGTLWEGPFRSVLVEPTRHALSVVGAYIDLNPVRAGIVEEPKDYRFSGYGEAVGQGMPEGHVLLRRLVLLQAGPAKAEARGTCGAAEGPDGDGGEAGAGLAGGHPGPRDGATETEEDEPGPVMGVRRGTRPLQGTGLRIYAPRRGGTGSFCMGKVRGCGGAVIGGKAWMEEWLRANKETYGQRKTPPRPMRGGVWDGLCSLRDSKKDVIG